MLPGGFKSFELLLRFCYAFARVFRVVPGLSGCILEVFRVF